MTARPLISSSQRDDIQQQTQQSQAQGSNMESAAADQRMDYDDLSDQGDFRDREAMVNDEPEGMSDLEKAKQESEILFWVQGVGSIKQVGGLDVYVKHQHSEESMKEIFRFLRNESVR